MNTIGFRVGITANAVPGCFAQLCLAYTDNHLSLAVNRQYLLCIVASLRLDFFFRTPQARFELATNRLTVDRSTAELLRIGRNERCLPTV